MEEIEIRLNNFLFNSGVLGFYKILENSNKLDLIKSEGNTIKIDPKVFENFETDYIEAMLHTFRQDTRWYTITDSKARIQGLDISDKEDAKKLDDFYKFLKKSLESASYKAGYEIAKIKDDENPYKYIEEIKEQKTKEIIKENTLKIIDYLKKHKEIYCMKDIMYGKIQMFWENVAFLNKTANTKDIKEEYKKAFVIPVQEYLEKRQKSEYNCIECGNVVGKSDSSSLSWLKDTGVDIARKKSAFWNFKEDAFICPICNLIYSCVPLGFTIVGNNSIFINQSESIKDLVDSNQVIEGINDMERQKLEKIQYHLFIKLSNQFKEKQDKEMYEKGIENIQVIKRKMLEKDKLKYEFNIISRDKMNAFKKSNNDFEQLVDKVVYIDKKPFIIYEEVISNFLGNINQYRLLDKLIREIENNNANINYLNNILNIQINSEGEKDLEEEKEIKEMKEKLRQAGYMLKKEYLTRKENENKLKSLILQLTNNLRTNNAIAFMDIVTRTYGALGASIPSAAAFGKMLEDKKYFRELGYAYVIGLETFVGSVSNKEENKDEK